MSNNFADRLIDGIKSKGAPIAIGLDPLYNKLPVDIRENKEFNDELDTEAAIDAIFEFSTKVLGIIANYVPAVKLNIAFFEKYYSEGIEVYYSLIEEADNLGLVVIGDVKRGDIPNTNEAYAQAHLANPEFTNIEDLLTPDAITVNPYFGIEALSPFVKTCSEQGKGLFVVVRSSNPEASSVQEIEDSQGKKVYEHIAEQVRSVADNAELIGVAGYSSIGAVVGATDAQAAQKLREIMPKSIFLVPGYGAQGGSAETIKACFREGTGAIITASRSVIYAYDREEYKDASSWEQAIEQSVKDMKEQVLAVIGQ